MTGQFDVRLWARVLHRLDVAEHAQHGLFLLAQLGRDGANAANHIINSLMQKRATNEVVNNASALVHSSCCRARAQLCRVAWDYSI